jgi:hypothetical protein
VTDGWSDGGGESGDQCKRSFPKLKGKNPEKCAEAFDAQRTADEARGEWIDPANRQDTFKPLRAGLDEVTSA